MTPGLTSTHLYNHYFRYYRYCRYSQVPFLRTEYLRSAFQLGHTNEVRISLDTQLAMSREEGAPRPPGGWCR